MVFSHRGMPLATDAPVPAGRGRCPLPAGADGGGTGCRRPGPGAGGADAAGRRTVSTIPGRIVFGSGPMTGRLAAYSAGQPPRTANRAAMPARVSPATTV